VVNFLIYCPEKKVTKAKKAEVKWVAYKHQKDSAVSFNPEGIDWTNFQKIVRTKSGKSFSTMPSMIEEQSKSDPPSITWRAFILQNKEYVKGTLVVISSDYDFQKWMDCIVENNACKEGWNNPHNGKSVGQGKTRSHGGLIGQEHLRRIFPACFSVRSRGF
jgi:hypothetical protein